MRLLSMCDAECQQMQVCTHAQCAQDVFRDFLVMFGITKLCTHSAMYFLVSHDVHPFIYSTCFGTKYM